MSDDDLDDDLSLDDSFDDFEKSEGTLGDLWRDNPAFKIGVIVGAVVLLFIIISFLTGGDDPVEESYVNPGSDVTTTPGTQEASPAYVEAVKEINEADVEEAFNTGGSSLPVPIEPPIGIVSRPDDEEVSEDPLQRWRRLQEERLEREIQQRETIVPDQNADADAARMEAIQMLSDSMAQQMSSILETKEMMSLNSTKLTDVDFLEVLREAEEEAMLEAEELSDDDMLDEEIVGEVLLPAGEILYAQLLTEANTDAPGPVLAQILSGPLKGSRILGSFEEQEELLTLNFETVVYEEESLSVDAVALDPATTLPAMATEVDHRYFKRIILPAAAAFVEGLAGAIGETTTVTVVTDGGTVVDAQEEPDSEQEVALGIEEAGQELGEILDEIADDTEVMIRIAAGTPIGILFLEPVTKDETVGFDEESDEDL